MKNDNRKAMEMICPNDEIVGVDMRETKAAYIITPITEPPAEHFDYYLNPLWELGQMVVKKKKGKHCMVDWGDGEYTLYPFRSGQAYCLRPVKEVK